MVHALSLSIQIPRSESNTNVVLKPSNFHNPTGYQEFLDLQFHFDVALTILYYFITKLLDYQLHVQKRNTCIGDTLHWLPICHHRKALLLRICYNSDCLKSVTLERMISDLHGKYFTCTQWAPWACSRGWLILIVLHPKAKGDLTLGKRHSFNVL